MASRGDEGAIAGRKSEAGPSPSAPRKPALTAAEARGLRDQELFERLEALLIETRGNIAEMARRLGRDRSTVRYHLRRFGMLDDSRR